MNSTRASSRAADAGVSAGFGWLALGSGLMLLTAGVWTVPALVWLAPTPWLVYLSRTTHKLQLPMLLSANILVHFIVWRGIIPAPGLLYYLIAAIYALIYVLPFVAHRLVATNQRSFAATLVFPLAWVALEFAFQRFVTPYGSWASLAYTQADSLAMLQVVSVAGIAGLSFLMTWTAAILAWCLRRETGNRERLYGLTAGSLAILAALTFGQLRLARPTDDSEHLRVAGLAPDLQLDRAVALAIAEVQRGATISDSAVDALVRAADLLNADLLERTRVEARAGAELVAWSETAARVLKSDEDLFLARVGELARSEGVHVIAALGVWNPEAQPPLENKIVAIDPSGRVEWHYHKARPIVGAESTLIDAGAGVIPALELERARLGAVICHDMDFPAFVRQASQAGTDVLVAPSNDWPLIAKLHADMATLRAIENGVTLMRPTSGGRSIAVDSLGRRLAVVDHPTTTMLAWLPVRGTKTIYGRIGDAFAWFCLIALAAILASRFRLVRGSA